MSGEYIKACGAQWFTHRPRPPQPISTPSHPLVYELENANVYFSYKCRCLTRPSEGVLLDGSLAHVHLEDLIIPTGNIDEYSFLDENALIRSLV